MNYCDSFNLYYYKIYGSLVGRYKWVGPAKMTSYIVQQINLVIRGVAFYGMHPSDLYGWMGCIAHEIVFFSVPYNFFERYIWSKT